MTDVVLDLDPARIDVRGRLRGLSEPHAEAIAASIAERGRQLQAIEVAALEGDPDYDWRLVAGLHRLRACQLLGTTVKAVATEAAPLEQRLAEVDENLIRRDLSALDRARFLAERKRLYETLHPETKHGSNQHTGGVANLATPRFSDETAEKTGLSERTIQRACELAAKLQPDVVERLALSVWADNQAALERLAKEPATRQRAAVRELLDDAAPAKSLRDALARLDGQAERAGPNRAAKMIDLWGRSSAAEKREFLAFLATADLPGAWTVQARPRAVGPAALDEAA